MAPTPVALRTAQPREGTLRAQPGKACCAAPAGEFEGGGSALLIGLRL